MMKLALQATILLVLFSFSEGSRDCSLSEAKNESQCHASLDRDNNNCVWCSVGHDAGICLTEMEALSIQHEEPETRCSSIVSSSFISEKGDDGVNPYSDDKNAETDDASPGSDDAAPETDDATPASDDAAPETDDATPASDDAAPDTDDDETPPSDDAAPDTDDESPAADDVSPTSDDEAPPTDDANATDDEAPPADDEAPPETDDAEPPTDDQAPPTTDDESPPGTDDKTPSTDDSVVPDDFWTCLQQKTLKDCDKAGCTYCATKAGYGLCLTGAAAESASNSSWFTCTKEEDVATTLSLSNNVNQRASSSYLRSSTTIQSSRVTATVQDPFDKSCMEAFLMDQTEVGCTSTTDATGVACEWCSIAGVTTLCLTSEQADMGSQFGISCDADKSVRNPYDPNCAVAFLQDQTEEGCLSAVDSDGEACEYCNLQGQVNVCLNHDQAVLVEQFGLECSENEKRSEYDVRDPYDTSCALAYLQGQTKDACVEAHDSDGESCTLCTLPGSVSVCLNSEQSALAQQFGLSCDETQSLSMEVTSEDPYDTSCLLAYLQSPTEEGCLDAQDQDGDSCKFCSLQGSFSLCLTPDQASYSEQMGITCDSTVEQQVSLPPDFVTCLENYEQDGCRKSHCTWCNTQVGMGFCLSTAVAEATKKCTFFDCEFGSGGEAVAVTL
jgi:hypothetical protein